MSNDLVINTYKEQIKESILKMQAIKIAGFDIIIEELAKRGIDCSEVLSFLEKIKNAGTKEELDKITIDEMNEIIENINTQITKALISSLEIAGVLERKSKMIAIKKSPNGKIVDNDKYIKVGTNLSSEINKHGISHGLSICIKNYCIQRIYQSDYRKKIEEQEQKLGITTDEGPKEIKNTIKSKDKKKTKLMEEIFDKEIQIDKINKFEVSKNEYFKYLNNLIENLNKYK